MIVRVLSESLDVLAGFVRLYMSASVGPFSLGEYFIALSLLSILIGFVFGPLRSLDNGRKDKKTDKNSKKIEKNATTSSEAVS